MYLEVTELCKYVCTNQAVFLTTTAVGGLFPVPRPQLCGVCRISENNALKEGALSKNWWVRVLCCPPEELEPHVPRECELLDESRLFPSPSLPRLTSTVPYWPFLASLFKETTHVNPSLGR